MQSLYFFSSIFQYVSHDVASLLVAPQLIQASLPGFYDLEIPDINGDAVKFDAFRGKVLVIANLASQCGFTESGYQQVQNI